MEAQIYREIDRNSVSSWLEASPYWAFIVHEVCASRRQRYPCTNTLDPRGFGFCCAMFSTIEATRVPQAREGEPLESSSISAALRQRHHGPWSRIMNGWFLARQCPLPFLQAGRLLEFLLLAPWDGLQLVLTTWCRFDKLKFELFGTWRYFSCKNFLDNMKIIIKINYVLGPPHLFSTFGTFF